MDGWRKTSAPGFHGNPYYSPERYTICIINLVLLVVNYYCTLRYIFILLRVPLLSSCDTLETIVYVAANMPTRQAQL